MRRSLLFAAMLLLVPLAVPSLATPQEPLKAKQASVKLTNKDVLDLLGAGLSPEVVVAKIKASLCDFDTSPTALKQLKAVGVPDPVLLAMVEAATDSGPPHTTSHTTSDLPVEVLAERAKRDAECPRCKGILLFYVDAKTQETHGWWLTDNQRKWFDKQREEVKKGKAQPRFWNTPHPDNADYIIFWTMAQGFRPYVYYVPRTETESGRVSGTYSSYGSGGYDWGTFSGRVKVERTYNEAKSGEWPYLDVVMVLYDARTGEKLYQTNHQGNWRWSKPEKDCLVDVVKFLRLRHP